MAAGASPACAQGVWPSVPGGPRSSQRAPEGTASGSSRLASHSPWIISVALCGSRRRACMFGVVSAPLASCRPTPPGGPMCGSHSLRSCTASPLPTFTPRPPPSTFKLKPGAWLDAGVWWASAVLLSSTGTICAVAGAPAPPLSRGACLQPHFFLLVPSASCCSFPAFLEVNF